MEVSFPAPGRRVTIAGTTGSGKTTLARQLSDRLGYPHVELDALHWEPDWTPAPTEVFRQRATVALTGETWIADGNYSKVRDIVLARADTVVWLDYPLHIILWRLLRRTKHRLVTGEELWNNNRERWRNHLGRDSLFLWALRTFRRRRRDFVALREDPDHHHLVFVHFGAPHEAEEWLRRTDLAGSV